MTSPFASPAFSLRLGTRNSPLAMAQANEVRAALIAAEPNLAVTLLPVTASGDRLQDRPLAEIGGKALWTKELDAWLLAGSIDIAVHSAKDVETLRPPGLIIAAVLPREDVADVLILRHAADPRSAPSIAALPPGARIGTSAPRRAAQLLHARPDCRIVPIRGNVATRLQRLSEGAADATLLARAGLNRLAQSDLGHRLDPEDWLPAPGQGAILIECRDGDSATRALLAGIDDPASHTALLAERALLAALGGNCHSPVALLTRADGTRLHLRARLYSPDGAHMVEAEASFAAHDSQAPASLAASLLAGAPASITANFAPPA